MKYFRDIQSTHTQFLCVLCFGYYITLTEHSHVIIGYTKRTDFIFISRVLGRRNHRSLFWNCTLKKKTPDHTHNHTKTLLQHKPFCYNAETRARLTSVRMCAISQKRNLSNIKLIEKNIWKTYFLLVLSEMYFVLCI